MGILILLHFRIQTKISSPTGWMPWANVSLKDPRSPLSLLKTIVKMLHHLTQSKAENKHSYRGFNMEIVGEAEIQRKRS